MSREDIIRMAREAGLSPVSFPETPQLERLVHSAYAAGAAVERNKLAAWMMAQGFATGHGDTMEQLLDALGTEIVDRARGQA